MRDADSELAQLLEKFARKNSRGAAAATLYTSQIYFPRGRRNEVSVPTIALALRIYTSSSYSVTRARAQECCALLFLPSGFFLSPSASLFFVGGDAGEINLALFVPRRWVCTHAVGVLRDFLPPRASRKIRRVCPQMRYRERVRGEILLMKDLRPCCAI